MSRGTPDDNGLKIKRAIILRRMSSRMALNQFIFNSCLNEVPRVSYVEFIAEFKMDQENEENSEGSEVGDDEIDQATGVYKQSDIDVVSGLNWKQLNSDTELLATPIDEAQN